MFIVALMGAGARADDWKIVSLQGDAFAFKDQKWNPLRVGDVVSDDSVVRTRPSAHVEFQRDRETISVGPDTQIQIFDRTGQRFTTVRQFFGTVGVEANVENVKHFSVRTPFIAAVVKGTIFGVHTDTQGSTVAVERGMVGVTEPGKSASVNVPAGNTASATVSGISVAKSAPGATAAASSTAAVAAVAAQKAASTAAASTSSAASDSGSSAASSASSATAASGNGDSAGQKGDSGASHSNGSAQGASHQNNGGGDQSSQSHASDGKGNGQSHNHGWGDGSGKGGGKDSGGNGPGGKGSGGKQNGKGNGAK